MKAIFIDRDGVINKDPGGWTKYNYVTTWKEFHFLPRALEALKILKENNVKVIVISNQAGVSKSYFSRQALKAINDKMLKEIEKNGGEIENVYYCLHSDEDNCNCRKPKTADATRSMTRSTLKPTKVAITMNIVMPRLGRIMAMIM